MDKAAIIKAISDAAEAAGANPSKFSRLMESVNAGLTAGHGGVTRFIEAGIFDVLMKHAEFRSLEQKVSVKGGGVTVGPIALPGYQPEKNERIGPRVKATMLSGDFAQSRMTIGPFAPPDRKFRMRDIVPVQGSVGTEIAYTRLVGCTNSAGGVSEGAQKPESDIDVSAQLVTVKQIATWIPASRQAARDVAAFAGWLDSILGGMVAAEEDDQILNGAGGADLSGFLNDADIQLQAFSVDIIETVRKAITKLQTGDPCLSGGWEPTALVMNPLDWEEAELQKDLDERYLLIPSSASVADGGPQPPRLWRVPVVVTPAIAANTALLGDFATAAALYAYDDLILRITDSHADYFIKNLLAVLAEERLALAIFVPQALVKVALA